MIDLPTLLKRSEQKILTLHPALQVRAFDLIKLAYREGIPIQVTQALRTIEEQEKLYAQGRAAPGNIVTWVKRSYHNFGLAFDFVVLSQDGTQALWTVDASWMMVGQLGKSLGLTWGGEWDPKTRDYPHFELTFGLSINELCAGKKPPQEVKKVELPKVDGLCKIDCEGIKAEGVIINGTSYAPVREIGEFLGMNIGWDNSTNTVTLKRKS